MKSKQSQSRASRNAVIVVLVVASIQMATSSLAPIISGMRDYFPNVSEFVIQMNINFISGASLVMSLITGKLATVIPRRSIAIGGLISFILGSILSFLVHESIVLMYCWAVFIGIGMGSYIPAAAGLLVDFVSDGMRERISGLQTSFINFGGVIISIGTGLLTAIAWNYGYLILLIAVPVLIVSIFLFPVSDEERAYRTKKRDKRQEKQKLNIPPITWFCAAMAFLFIILYNVFGMNLALLIVETGRGDSTTSGWVNAVFMLGGGVAGLLFGRLSPKLR